MRRGMVLVTVGAVALTAGGARFLVECRRSRSQSRSVFLQKTTRNWRLLSVLGSKLPSTGKDAYALSPIPTIFFEAEEITGAVNSGCTNPARSASRAPSRSTPPAGRASASNISRHTTSCATARSC